MRRVGNRALLAVANTFLQTKLTDLCYGYFAFYRKYLDHLDLMSSGFEIETELTIRAVLAELPASPRSPAWRCPGAAGDRACAASPTVPACCAPSCGSGAPPVSTEPDDLGPRGAASTIP